MSILAARAPDALKAEGWRPAALAGGDVLWREQDPAGELGWVTDGELEVVVGDLVTGRVLAGALVGEAGAFAQGQTRTATVRALRPTRLWVLPGERLAELRQSGHPTYDQLLESALEALGQRIDLLNQRVAHRLNRTDSEPPQPSLVSSAVAPASVRGTAPPPPPAHAGLLRAIVGANVAAATLDALGRAFVARWMPRGQVLCHQGEPAESMFIVASGTLGAERPRAGGRTLTLAELSAGSLVGTSAMVNGGVRTASLVMLRSGWLFEISRTAMTELPSDARRVLREALLAALRTQLEGANAQLRSAQGPAGTVAFDDAVGASGSLEGTFTLGPGFDLSAIEHATEAFARPGSESEALLATIRGQVIGAGQPLVTPFGKLRVVYADYTASGRSLGFIEDFIRERVLPTYANTHTEASASGLQTTRFREEARAAVARSVGATEEDAVIFVGSGATGAINKLIDILGLRIAPDLDARWGLSQHIAQSERPVVFVGPYEHHSNILPWRHSLADVHIIPLDPEGRIDTVALERKLVEYAARPLKIGSFSAASNVTGTATDVRRIAALLHAHGALSFWDYAAAGPYVRIEMHPEPRHDQIASPHKDAIFLSPHKFVGGPGTPGVLVVKRALVQNTVPTQPGGGTVEYVDVGGELYSTSIEHREEAGTPAIVESIRCGLVFQLKDAVGADTIEARESSFVRSALSRWVANPAIRILGNPNLQRLSITSFMVRYGERFLHYNFVIALLNDLFGIQARGGCSCAGPYGAMLLGMNEDLGRTFRARAEEGWTSVKPGWARVNFNYFISEAEFRYIVDAVDLLARYGWALMPRYEFDVRTAIWTHRGGAEFQPESLASFARIDDSFSWPRNGESLPESVLGQQMASALTVLKAAVEATPDELCEPDLPSAFHDVRWFPLPHEVASYLRARNAGAPELTRDHYSRAPFEPRCEAASGPASTGACPQD